MLFLVKNCFNKNIPTRKEKFIPLDLSSYIWKSSPMYP